MLQIVDAKLIRSDVWAVWVIDPRGGTPWVMAIAAVDPPTKCLGGVWCKHFGCSYPVEPK